MLWMMFACSGPGNFESFLSSFQKQACPAAEAECASAGDYLGCDAATGPSCGAYSSVAAKECLKEESVCIDGKLVSSAFCDAVCTDLPLAEIGGAWPPACQAMLACDEALASAPSYTSVFGGANDPLYGQSGSCYDGGQAAACADACTTAVEGLRTAADAFVLIGDISTIPSECL